jgi:HPt (histidine-containing phosphotransfer) domain-containing protein
MPGVSGQALAHLLRAVCGARTRLFAMSGSGVGADRTGAFDGFLLKPFSIDTLCAALEKSGATAQVPADPKPDHSAVLSTAIYSSFLQSMSGAQVRQLYAMCLDDAEARIGRMREVQSDADAFRRAAHSIKGGCGMVGALELARLAGAMEENGPEILDSSATLDEFLAASARLRRILDAELK